MTDGRDRNDVLAFTNHVRQVSNSIVRKLNQTGSDVVTATIPANSRTLTADSWSSAVPMVATRTPPAGTPYRNLNLAKRNAETDEFGIEYDTLLVNLPEMNSPLNFAQFNSGKSAGDAGDRIVVGAGQPEDVLADLRTPGGVPDQPIRHPADQRRRLMPERVITDAVFQDKAAEGRRIAAVRRPEGRYSGRKIWPRGDKWAVSASGAQLRPFGPVKPAGVERRSRPAPGGCQSRPTGSRSWLR
jgi:hypothetical protein